MPIDHENAGITRELQKKIFRIALERMRKECESDFQFLEHFRSHGVVRFLEWIRSLDKAERLEAALSRTCQQLKLPFHHVDCGEIPNFERWVRHYRDWPLNSGLDLTWRPRRFVKRLAALIRERMGPLEGDASQSFRFSANSPFAIPQIRGGLDLNTRVADIVLYQFLAGDKSLFDLSYISVLGLGPTGWQVYSDADCINVVEQLPAVIAEAKELI